MLEAITADVKKWMKSLRGSADKSRAENPEDEHSLKPRNEIISKLHEAMCLFLGEAER